MRPKINKNLLYVLFLQTRFFTLASCNYDCNFVALLNKNFTSDVNTFITNLTQVLPTGVVNYCGRTLKRFLSTPTVTASSALSSLGNSNFTFIDH